MSSRISRIFRLLAAALLLMAIVSEPAMAVRSFVVKDIKVNGLERISAGTVFNYLPIKVGDRISEQSVGAAIRKLFKTGFFRDVRISRQDDILVVTVAERPSIAELKISGSKKISEDDLKKKLKESGLAVGYIFNRSLFDKIEQEIRQQYYNMGYYSAGIEAKVESAGGNRVNVSLVVKEGKAATIRDINFIGNHTFSDDDLLSFFTQQPTSRKRIFSKRDQYSQLELKADLEKLENHYLDNGFLDYATRSSQVSISPDREGVFITVTLTEGKQYKIGKVGIKGKVVIDRAEMEKRITVKQGEVFSRKKITGIIDKLNELHGKQGYANARITMQPRRDKKRGVVDFDFLLDPGKRVYIRRINITGNNITRDEVIRRELRQIEGGWFSTTNLDISRRRLQRLGFFDDIQINMVPVPGSPDLVDMNLTVKERSTGSIQFGGGYSDETGFFINLSYSERNAFGSGNDIVVSYDNSQSSTVYELSYSDPYFTRTGISQQFEVHSRSNDAAATGTGGYIMQADGIGLNYGFPISDDKKIGLGIGFEQITIDLSPSSAAVAQDFVSLHGRTNNLLRINTGWSQDTLNDYRFPTKGIFYKLYTEIGVPGGDLTYTRTTLDTSGYIPLGKRSTVRARFNLGYADGYGDTNSSPFFKNFFVGGGQSIRGYRVRGLGPKDILTNDPIGGTKMITTNLEYFFPFPGSKDQSDSMRLSLFLDGGMVYAAPEKVDLGEMRFSAGFAFTWFTPAFPIALSWGWPLNSRPGDQLESFQFSIGIPLQ